MITTTPRPGITSGFCGIGRHPACRGTYAGYDCLCDCHTEPPSPELEPALTPDLHTQVVALLGDVRRDHKLTLTDMQQRADQLIELISRWPA
jgi:hypothetical protein